MARRDALDYHERGRPGKIEVVATKPLATQRDLSLAYSPGVAEPCRAIVEDQRNVDRYTARRNLVGVISNGTAVLGLGDIGPYAAKPVMEGKAVLFKRYADIDVFDIEINEKDPERFVEVVAALEPTFGGINLEDIAAPASFFVEEELERRLDIPVFHDDQHGTGIISAAALMNVCEIQNKDISKVHIVCIGAGAAAIGCMRLWLCLGVPASNIVMYDDKGLLHLGREDLDPLQAAFAKAEDDPRKTFKEGLIGADVLIGLSVGGIVSKEDLMKMGDRPLILALANPDPEIRYEDAVAARPDAIVCTGRSDYPNQVNNVLGFPYIFRGALDVAATHINEPMKLAAAHALANLAREGVPESVSMAYDDATLKFGEQYIIPKPMDLRSLSWVAPAVADAAIQSGVAVDTLDIEQYRAELEQKLSPTRRVMWQVSAAAKKKPRRIVLPEGEHEQILRAAEIAASDGLAQPVLLGQPDRVAARAEELGVELDGVEVIDWRQDKAQSRYAEALWKKRQRKGLTLARASQTLREDRTYFAMMMLAEGDVDGVVAGVDAPYPRTIRPALEVIGVRDNVRRACGAYLVITKRDVKLLADTTINIDPDAETLAEIAILASDFAKQIGMDPNVAMLSFSNFGDAHHPRSRTVAEATQLARKARPALKIDGEMQADVALSQRAREPYPFLDLNASANVLVFPNLDAGNIAYKLLAATGAELIGPIVLGVDKPVNVLQQGASAEAIVHMMSLTVAHANRLDANPVH